ncbi:hypothetical protein KUTeg_010013 [Tegillarca granosa]|uniref:NADH dehydrogenase subunit 4L n=1 Tax=Tegillarca granosa TaxID=220873 RepID=A0ABQ9F8L5_TEGGR|nr:hypothetical protein KUTeg_010013 [Tegillarca granosa]
MSVNTNIVDWIIYMEIFLYTFFFFEFILHAIIFVIMCVDIILFVSLGQEYIILLFNNGSGMLFLVLGSLPAGRLLKKNSIAKMFSWFTFIVYID